MAVGFRLSECMAPGHELPVDTAFLGIRETNCTLWRLVGGRCGQFVVAGRLNLKSGSLS